MIIKRLGNLNTEKITNMTLQFTTTSKVSVSNGVKILVYSSAGMGKTLLCATAPTPIIISAESGLLSLNPKNQQKILGQVVDIPVITITTYQELQEAYLFIKNDPHAQKFQTICIDSITEVAETILANAKLEFKDARQAYGVLIENTVKLIKDFRDLPGKHVYMSAKQAKFKDETTGGMLFGPSMPGNALPQQIPYLFDEVFNLNIAKSEQREYRYLRTQPDLQYDAKDRSGALDAIEQPNLSNIINKIINHV